MALLVAALPRPTGRSTCSLSLEMCIQARLRWRPSASRWWTKECSVTRWLDAMNSIWQQSISKRITLFSTNGLPSSIQSPKISQRSLLTLRSASQFRDQAMSKSSWTIRVDQRTPLTRCSCLHRLRRNSNSWPFVSSKVKSSPKWTPGEPLMPISKEHSWARRSRRLL